MVKINIEYRGDLRCKNTHGPSGTELLTDAPVDNHGRGESFSPTDLVATALGSCIATTMGIFAKRHEVNLEGMKITVTKEMVATPVRRIARLTTEIHVPQPSSIPERAALERAASTCPVHQSLHPGVDAPITFHWQGE